MEMSEVLRGGVSKEKRYGWAVNGKRSNYRLLHKSLLKVAPYQRPASMPKVARMRQEFCWGSFGTLHVTYRDGQWWIIDGQHRWLATLALESVQELPVLVIECIDEEEEARLFLNTNTLRKPVSALEKFKARIYAKDETALKLQQLFDAVGRRLDRGKAPNTITGVGMLEKQMRRNRLSFYEAWAVACEWFKGREFNLEVFSALFELDQKLRKGGSHLNDRAHAGALAGADIDRVEYAVRQAMIVFRNQPNQHMLALLGEVNRKRRKRIVLEGL
jgi:hypothetical protein